MVTSVQIIKESWLKAMSGKKKTKVSVNNGQVNAWTNILKHDGLVLQVLSLSISDEILSHFCVNTAFLALKQMDLH